MYKLEIKEEADRIFRKLERKNPKQLKIIGKKIQEIRENPSHSYKNLRNPLQRFNRVHIDKHFVLIFRIDHGGETVVVYYFDHHDNVYKWRPREVEG
jgi:YafQ family addiction module toxin component